MQSGVAAFFISIDIYIESKLYSNMKKLIRLTESDLHQIVKETVNKILSEHDMYAMGKGMGNLYRKRDMYNNHAAINQSNGGENSVTQACHQKARDCDDKSIRLGKAAKKALGSNPNNNNDYSAGWNDAVSGRRNKFNK